MKQGYREDGGLFCQSDDDEQLILTVPFKQIVNLTSVAIQGPVTYRRDYAQPRFHALGSFAWGAEVIYGR